MQLELPSQQQQHAVSAPLGIDQVMFHHRIDYSKFVVVVAAAAAVDDVIAFVAGGERRASCRHSVRAYH